ncbi:stage II sporulation protein M [Hydrogenispora ethanolica]|uniref:Stage II sporulation protein M n=1 Tax=Hydrogenispora ethanolica TaxID=1082276 RepID=A0A4R1R976_HYDET|nr:stage II sporulation protein M [Hydrogenispora ethanolica]TCL62188.1 stage II sporulation protein M [Hydrogenispora ethanolica]
MTEFGTKLRQLLKRDRRLFLILGLLLVGGAWLGELLPRLNPEAARDIERMALEHFGEIARRMKGASLFVQILVIWVNNISASILAFCAGLIFPPVPILMLAGNGLLIGVFQNYTEAHAGLSVAQYYLGLLPHGIFELPAYIIAIGLGFRFGMIPYRLIRHYLTTKEHLPLFREFLGELRYYAIFLFILFTVAAAVEVAVTPYVMQLFLKYPISI